MLIIIYWALLDPHLLALYLTGDANLTLFRLWLILAPAPAPGPGNIPWPWLWPGPWYTGNTCDWSGGWLKKNNFILNLCLYPRNNICSALWNMFKLLLKWIKWMSLFSLLLEIKWMARLNVNYQDYFNLLPNRIKL